MAISQSKRSVQRTQPQQKRIPASKSTKKSRTKGGAFPLQSFPLHSFPPQSFPPQSFPLSFPQVRGKVAEAIELFTAGEYHAVTILFQDKTALSLALEPGFTVRPTYEDRKSGTIQVLKKWAPIRTGSWRKRGDPPRRAFGRKSRSKAN